MKTPSAWIHLSFCPSSPLETCTSRYQQHSWLMVDDRRQGSPSWAQGLSAPPTMPDMAQTFDVCIRGAGIVGRTLLFAGA